MSSSKTPSQTNKIEPSFDSKGFPRGRYYAKSLTKNPSIKNLEYHYTIFGKGLSKAWYDEYFPLSFKLINKLELYLYY